MGEDEKLTWVPKLTSWVCTVDAFVWPILLRTTICVTTQSAWSDKISEYLTFPVPMKINPGLTREGSSKRTCLSARPRCMRCLPLLSDLTSLKSNKLLLEKLIKSCTWTSRG